MKIAGWRKTSLIDYPGCISTVLFTQGCNFRCPYCHNPDLISIKAKKSYMDLEYFYNFLDRRLHLLDGVAITGGEPTLQPDIVEFIKKIKDKGLQVKLDTNGSNFEVVKRLLQLDLVDYIAMDIKNPLPKYGELINGNMEKNKLREDKNIDKIKDEINQTLNLLLNSNLDYELRTTVVPGMHEPEDIKDIASWIEGANKYIIQNFRPDNTYAPELQDLTQLPEARLEKFSYIARDYVENVQIRD